MSFHLIASACSTFVLQRSVKHLIMQQLIVHIPSVVDSYSIITSTTPSSAKSSLAVRLLRTSAGQFEVTSK